MRINRLIILVILSVISGLVKGQSPTGLPFPNAPTAYYNIGWLRADSGLIFPSRTPNFTPLYPFTTVGYLRPGIDTTLWLWTGQTWNEIGKGGGLVSLVGVSPIVVSGDSVSCPTCSVGGGITQLTGDGTAGPGAGSQPFTLATVNGTPGSFGSASSVADFTTNVKGLITLAGSIPIQISESQVTNLVSDLASKQGTITLGSTSQYFRGDLSLATFPTNLSAFTNGPGYITTIAGITAGGALAGTYPNPTLASVVTAGTCTNCALTYNAAGQITVASSGSGGGAITGGGGLTPLFTNGISGSTMTFTLSNAAANSIFGNNTGSSAAPAFFVPTITTLNGWASGTIALLGSSQTFTGNNIFNGTTTYGAAVAFSTTNSISVGGSSDVASHMWSRSFNSDVAAVLSSTTGNSASMAIGANNGITLLSTGQAQLNNYVANNSFTGSGIAFIENDGSGNLVQIPIGNIATQTALNDTAAALRATTSLFYPVQLLSPIGNSADSFALGGVAGPAFQNDSLYFANNKLFIYNLNASFSTLVAGDSVMVHGSGGQVKYLPSSAIGGGGAVSSVSDNGGGTLTISPTTGAVLAGINLANSNTWTATNNSFKNILPSATTTYSLGSSGAYWNNVYTNNLDVNNILPPSNLVIQLATGQLMETYINGVIKEELLSTGQKQFNGYTSSSAFTSGTPTTLLAPDASGVLWPVALGTNLSFTGQTLNASGGGGGGVALIGPIDSAAGVANGMRINGSSIYAQSATTTVPGMVNLTNQSFKGPKTFDSTYHNNALVHRTAQIGDSTYAFTTYMVSFGTSITQGAGPYYGNQYYGTTATPTFLPYGFSYQLCHDVGMLEYTNTSLFPNMGQTGTRLVKTSTGDSSLIDRITDSHDMPYESATIPLIVFEYLTNDAAAGITKSQVYSAVIQATDTAIAHGFGLNQILWVDAPFSSASRNGAIWPLDSVMIVVADSLGTMAADDYTYIKNNGGLINVCSDSVHPNARGAMLMVQSILNSNPRLARVGRMESFGHILAHNDLTVGWSGPWPSRWTVQGNPFVASFVGGDIMIAGGNQAGIEAGFGSLVDSTSTMFAFRTQKTIPLVPTTANQYNTIVGFKAAGNGLGLTQNYTVAVGYDALLNCTSCGSNVSVGASTLLGCTNCVYNTAVGTGALAGGVGFSANTAVGYQAGLVNTSNDGVFIGYQAGLANTGANNVFVGAVNCTLCTTATDMAVVGEGSATSNITGNYFASLGTLTLPSATGSYYVAVGFGAGFHETSGTYATFLGPQAGYQDVNSFASTNCSYCTAIGGVAQVTQSNTTAIAGNVSSGAWNDVGINLPNADSYLTIANPDARANHGGGGWQYQSIATTALSGTGSAVTITFAAQSYPPFVVGEQIVVSGAAPSGYNGTYTVTTASTTFINAVGSATGSQTVAGTVTPYTLGTPIAWHWTPYQDSLGWANRAGVNMWVVFENRSNYFTATQYLDNLVGPPSTFAAVVQGGTDSALYKVPLAYGTFTATITTVANCTSPTSGIGHYMQIGKQVTVDIPLSVSITVTSTATEYYVSLPVTSTISSGTDLTGQGTGVLPMTLGLGITGNTANHAADVTFTPTGTGSNNMYLHFTYTVD